MPNLSSVSLKWKVPGVVVSLCLLVAFGIGLTSYYQFRSTLLHENSVRFEELIESEAGVVELWFHDTIKSVGSMGVNPAVADAATAFDAGWESLGTNVETQLQRLYISQNMFPTGEKHRLDMAEDGSFYSRQHQKYHPYFRSVLELNSYYDVFIFDVDGNLVYSVFKELDYATNFLNGAYAQSGLGRAFRQARDAAKGEVKFIDYSNYAPSANAPAGFVSTPIFDEQSNLVGVYAIQFPINVVQGFIDRARDDSAVDQLFLVGTDGRLRTEVHFPSGIAPVYSSYSTAFVDDAITSTNGIISFDAVDQAGEPVVAAASSVEVLDTKWFVVSETSRTKLLAPLFHMRNMMIINGGVSLFVLSVLGWLFSRSITKPATQLEQNLRNLVAEDFEFEIGGLKRGDEFGKSAAALSDLRTSLIAARELDVSMRRKSLEQQEVVEKLTAALLELSDGNLAYKLKEPFAPEFEPLRENFNSSLDTLNELIVQVIESCKSISIQSGEISKSADNLSNRTENQAATLEETAAALDQLTAGVKQAAKSANEVEGIVDEARGSAQTGKAIVDDAVSAMEEIEESSNQISEIIAVIDDIAFQTNLLALNAGVEAGRAGDAGKGFAVVASEVGSLAQRSSDAAKAIKKLISNSARQVSKGVKNVSDAGEAITTIVERVSHISELMRETASSASEQSHSLDEINIGVNQLDQVTQENAAMVELSTEASHEMRSKSESLTETVSQFKTQSQSGLKVPTTRPELNVVKNNSRAPEAPSVQKEEKAALVQLDSAANDDVWMNF